MRVIRILILLLFVLLPGHVMAETISIIGTGRVASALGPAFANLGHEIVYGSRNPHSEKVKELLKKTGKNARAVKPSEAALAGQIIVTAIPWSAAEEVVKSLGDLSGKIIIDPTNPVVGRDTGNLDHAMGYQTSNAELIQKLAPDAYVVKAFNTLSAKTMADPKSAGGPVSILIAGDNDEAKQLVANLAAGIGLNPVDVGGLHYSNILEGMLVIWMKAQFSGKGYNYYLRSDQ